MANNEITLKVIDDGAVKRKLEEDTLVVRRAEDTSPIVAVLEETNRTQRFENLYEILKKKCGNQIKVTQQMEEKFAEKYDINCKNENISDEYVKKIPKAKYQDDFTYLRTMIAHGSPDYFEEIEERLPREIRKIVKVISDLESECKN